MLPSPTMQAGAGPRSKAGLRGVDTGGHPLTTPLLPGRPFSPRSLLNKAVCNVIASLTQARRFEYNDLHLTRLIDLVQTMIKESSGILPMVRVSGRLWEEPLHPQGGQGEWCYRKKGPDLMHLSPQRGAGQVDGHSRG